MCGKVGGGGQGQDWPETVIFFLFFHFIFRCTKKKKSSDFFGIIFVLVWFYFWILIWGMKFIAKLRDVFFGAID